MLQADGVGIEFEVVLEGRIELEAPGPDNRRCGVARPMRRRCRCAAVETPRGCLLPFGIPGARGGLWQHRVMPTPLLSFLSSVLGRLPEQVRAAADSARPVEVGIGEPLLRAGGRWSSLWWVECGVLRLFYLDRQGQSASKNFYLDGALLWPLTPALAEQAADFWIEAIAPTRVWALSWPAWRTACGDWSAWQALERRTLAALLDDKMRRERLFLQCSATERYQDLCALRPEWLARIPLRHLASYLGVTDVALSRIRRRLNPG